MASETSALVVAYVGQLQPGGTKKFFRIVNGCEEECFVVNHEGTFYAYVNRCCHIPISLDWIENQLMTEDKRYLQCATHGAQYLPDTGECIWGPPCGKFLTRIALTIRGDEVIAVADGDHRPDN
jgi:nitrite reductase/ring-hydroxylating ferredoxin subunit